MIARINQARACPVARLQPRTCRLHYMCSERRRHGKQDGNEHWYLHPILNHPITSALIVAGVITLISVLWARHEPGPTDEERIAKLAPGATVQNFRETLGSEPTIKRAVTKRWDELLWMREKYAVQAIASKDGSAEGYSVTTHSLDFHPTIPDGPHKLGESTFQQELGDLASEVNTFTPAGADYQYSEAVEGSMASHGKTYVMTDSLAGRGGGGDRQGLALANVANSTTGGEDCSSGWCPYKARDRPDIARLRRKAVVTTFTILGPRLTLQDLPEFFRFGPTLTDEDMVPGLGRRKSLSRSYTPVHPS